MSVFLDEPNKDKKLDDGEGSFYKYGRGEMQGWRSSMEDASIAEDLEKDKDGNDRSIFGIFDGHGGNQVAEFVRDHFVKELVASENFQNENYPEALEDTFKKMDELMKTKSGEKELKSHIKDLEEPSKEDAGDSEEFNPWGNMEGAESSAGLCGCTACVVLVVGNKVYCANAGDSRCVLSRGQKPVEMSIDHKPSNPDEEKRIKEAGGHVFWDRVNGMLNVSRALGDLIYKNGTDLDEDKQQVTCVPGVKTETLDKDCEFLILACDGIWDCMSNQEIVDYIHDARKDMGEITDDSVKVSKMVAQLLDDNLAKDEGGLDKESAKPGAGTDNMSAIIVFFKHND